MYFPASRERNGPTLTSITSHWIALNHRYFLAFAFRVLRGFDFRATPDGAADALQDALEELFRYRFETFEPDGNLEAYIHKVIWNLCCRAARRFGRLHAFPQKGEDLEIEPSDTRLSSDPGTAAQSTEALRLIEEYIAGLKQNDRDVLVRLHVEGEPISEIAEALGITKGNAKVRLFRARQKLRNCLIAKGIVREV